MLRGSESRLSGRVRLCSAIWQSFIRRLPFEARCDDAWLQSTAFGPINEVDNDSSAPCARLLCSSAGERSGHRSRGRHHLDMKGDLLAKTLADGAHPTPAPSSTRSDVRWHNRAVWRLQTMWGGLWGKFQQARGSGLLDHDSALATSVLSTVGRSTLLRLQ